MDFPYLQFFAPMADFYEIAPGGDVDLILPHTERRVIPVGKVFESINVPPKLRMRRDWEPEVDADPDDERIIGYDWEPDSWNPDSWNPDSSVRNEGPWADYPRSEKSEADLEMEQAVSCSGEDADLTSKEYFVRMRVTSRHLMLASPYFKRNLESGMSESLALSSKGRVDFHMNVDNAEAMLIVMYALHGRFRQIPHFPNVPLMAQIAILVDYLECHEAMGPVSDIWIEKLRLDMEFFYSERLIQCLCISLVFDKKMEFVEITRKAIRQASGPIQTLGFPIRESVVAKIDQHRNYALYRIFSVLERLLHDFRIHRSLCSWECDSMRYGVLSKELSIRGLFPLPQVPFLGYSFEDIHESLYGIWDFDWCHKKVSHSNHSKRHRATKGCQLRPLILTIIDEADRHLTGLVLSDFQ